jgi:hypothetical protein
LGTHHNDANKTLGGIIFDAFGTNCLTALYFLFLLYACKTTLPDKFHKIRECEKSGKLCKLEKQMRNAETIHFQAFLTLWLTYTLCLFRGTIEIEFIEYKTYIINFLIDIRTKCLIQVLEYKKKRLLINSSN